MRYIKVNKTYKLRIYPNKTQELNINRSIGGSRFVYNNFLDVRIKSYEYYGQSSSYYKDNSELVDLKNNNMWLYDLSSDVCQNALKDLEVAFKNFFEHRRGYPKFKSKHKSKWSYRVRGVSVKFKDNKVQLPKLGYVKFRQSFVFPENLKVNNVTILKTRSGKYFANLCCVVKAKPKPKTNKQVGVDLGIKEFATLSDGTVFENSKFYRKYEGELTKAKRKFSKMKKGSNNREKQRVKVARIHEKITNCRFEYIQSVTNYLVNNYDTIVVEDLNVDGMKRNHNMAKSISDASFFEFKRQLEYKCLWYDKELVVIDRWYPSSKTCSNCGNVKEKLTLNERTYTCEECGLSIDRDLNASINILTVGTTGLA